jgi:hypothetical protein
MLQGDAKETRFRFAGWAESQVTAVAITRDCNLVVVASHDEVAIFAPKTVNEGTDKPMWKVKHGAHNTIVSVATSSDGTFIAVATGQKDVTLQTIVDEDETTKQRPNNTNSSGKTKDNNADNKDDSESGEEDSQNQPQEGDMVFQVQLAHGSATRSIRDFTNVKELYDSIKAAFSLPKQYEVAYVTLNTHLYDGNRLLGGQIGLDDFMFAHVIDTHNKKKITVRFCKILSVPLLCAFL